MSNMLDLIQLRRSRYAIASESPLPDNQLVALLKTALKNLPTAFNMQNTRMVLLLEDAHAQLWNHIVKEALRPVTPPQNFARTEKKLAGFAAGHGTLLYYNSQNITEQFKKENPLYAANFDSWSLQQNGMLQLAVWTLLSEQGLGASLQHYNPLIDEAVQKQFALPADWQLLAQMPFGTPTAPAGEKDFAPVDERFLLFRGV